MSESNAGRWEKMDEHERLKIAWVAFKACESALRNLGVPPAALLHVCALSVVYLVKISSGGTLRMALNQIGELVHSYEADVVIGPRLDDMIKKYVVIDHN